MNGPTLNPSQKENEKVDLMLIDLDCFYIYLAHPADPNFAFEGDSNWSMDSSTTHRTNTQEPPLLKCYSCGKMMGNTFDYWIPTNTQFDGTKGMRLHIQFGVELRPFTNRGMEHKYHCKSFTLLHHTLIMGCILSCIHLSTPPKSDPNSYLLPISRTPSSTP